MSIDSQNDRQVRFISSEISMITQNHFVNIVFLELCHPVTLFCQDIFNFIPRSSQGKFAMARRTLHNINNHSCFAWKMEYYSLVP